MEVDLHMHSMYSPDSRSRPERIARRAVEIGLGAIAVTDHNSWKGTEAVRKVAPSTLLVVPGAELKTERGDLLALFVEEEIRTRVFADAVDEIRARGGIAIVPHPGDAPKMRKEDIALADGVEVFNATLHAEQNARSAAYADELGKPGIGVSDAHMVREVGNGATRIPDCSDVEEVRNVLLKNPEVSRRKESDLVLHKANSFVLFGLKGLWSR
jgi:predicted metal-dependent phosphoesterase TrpH